MAQWIGATPDPEGLGYTFTADDGSSSFFPRDPEIDALAEQVGALPPEATAQLETPGAQESVSDVGPNMSVAPPEAPPPVEPGVVPPGVGPTVEAAAEGAPPPPDPAAQAEAQAAMLANLASIKPGSPGVSQATLQKRAGQGVETPQTSSTVVEGAKPFDQEAAAARELGRAELRDIAREREEAKQAFLASDAEDAAFRAMMAENQARAQRAAVTELNTRVKNDEQQLVALRQERARGKIDPWAGMGDWAPWAAAIGAMLGTYAAIRTGTPNFALQTINEAINRNVQRQKDEFDRLGDEAENQYRDLVRRYGDRDQAESALRLMQKDAAAQMGEKIAASRRSQESQLAYREWVAKDFMAANEEERAFREASIGKHTQTVSNKFAYPEAPRAPRRDPEKFLKHYIELRKLGIDEGQARMQARKLEADATKAEAEAAALKGGSPEERKQLADKASGVENNMAAIEAFVRKNGGKIDPVTGKIEGLDAPSTAWAHLGETERKAAEQDLASIGIGYSRVVNEGGELSPAQAEKVEPKLGWRDAPLQADLEAKYQELLRRKQTAGAGVGAATRATRERNRQGAAVERAAGGALDLKEE